VNPHVRFEDEADAEYRLASRWYEGRRERLGLEFLDAVDATIDQIVAIPQAGSPVPRMSPDWPVRRRAVTRLTGIRILAIAHDRRKPGYWEGRLK